jgi:Lipocalin-like domain
MKKPTAVDFIGTWRLLDYSFIHDDGVIEKPWGTDVRGYLLYSAEGYMSGNLSPARRRQGVIEREHDMINPGMRPRRTRRYIAYTGRYTVDGDTVTHHVEASLFPHWVGRPEVRHFCFEGNRLTLRTDPLKTGRHTMVAQLLWERVPATE